MTGLRPPYRLSHVLPPLIAGAALFGLAFVGADEVLRLRTQPGSRDLDLFAAIVAKVAAGQPYYAVLAEELPARGYPVRPVFAWRLPTLTWLLAIVPHVAAQAVLWAIGALAIWGWARVLKLRVGAITLVLIAPLWLAFSSLAVYMPELWSGQLIALGLAMWMLERDKEALTALVLAALIREHALLALMAVAVAAWRQHRSPTLWAVAVAGILSAYSAHIVLALRHTPAGGITRGWGGMPGWAFVVSAIQGHVLLIAAPYWVAALTAAVCVPALWMWHEGRLVAVVFTLYAAAFCIAARPDNWYWGLLILPLLPLGCIALARRYGAGGADLEVT